MGNENGALILEEIDKRFADVVALDGVSLSLDPGSVLAVLGPSGCGKTTLLRVIAGLDRPDRGRIELAGRVLNDDDEFVPTERRSIGMVFQDWALFPHLDVGNNVAYGIPKVERTPDRIDEALAMVGLSGFANRMPSTLSGGQQQRVALARALARRPPVLLLDEPFSNLDASLRSQVRTDVHGLLVELGVTSVFVTHDQEEAFVLGDRVAVMNHGRIEQTGTAAELYHHPNSRWVADFVGDANFLPGVAGKAQAQTILGAVPLRDSVSGNVEVLVRPESLKLTDGTAWEIVLVEYYGHDSVYQLRSEHHTLRLRVPGAPTVDRGARVDISYTGGPAPAWSASTL